MHYEHTTYPPFSIIALPRLYTHAPLAATTHTSVQSEAVTII